MLDTQIDNLIRESFPEFEFQSNRYGKLFNVDLRNEREWYQFDVIENEVGVIYRYVDSMDMAGSDISFGTLDEAITFLIDYRLKNNNAPNM